MVENNGNNLPKPGLLDHFTRADELLAELLMINRGMAASLGIAPAQAVSPNMQALKEALTNGQTIPYDIIGGDSGLAMDSARSDQQFEIEGTNLVAATDGDLDGVTIRFNSSIARPVPIKYFNPWSQPFFKIYLTHTAQSGKTLYLAIGRGTTAITGGISFAGQTGGMRLQPEWAALMGVDKNFYAYGSGGGFGTGVEATYSVPATKTLYITGMSAYQRPQAAADYDHHLYFQSYIVSQDPITLDLTTHAEFGGIGGGGLDFNKPQVIAGGLTFILGIATMANVTCIRHACAWGYEL